MVCPSRGRPESVAELAEAWRATTTGAATLLVVVDEDDPQLEAYKRLAAADLPVAAGTPLGSGVALNALMPRLAEAQFAVGFLTDDHRPRTEGWDRRFVDELTRLGTGLVYGDDLLQGRNLPTAVAMTSDIVQTLGYFVPPGMTRMYFDSFWLGLGQELGRITYLEDVVVEHLQFANQAASDATRARDRAALARWIQEAAPGALARLRQLLGDSEPALQEETAVIVPTINRPTAAEPFMRSLRATTSLGHAYAVLAYGDPSEEAWRAAGATVLTSAAEGWSPKVNMGYRLTSEPWLFFTGDDVRFRPGWLDQAQLVARTHHASVVGTNDLGNPRVMAGEHAVHYLVARDYIDDAGASWDGPGVVCHEGYKVWYSDDEVVTAAKQRGIWAMALSSRVEHLHPLWGKGGKDSNPAPPEDLIMADRALFLRRRRQNDPQRVEARS